MNQPPVHDCAGPDRALQVCRVYIGSFNGLRPIREDINPNCVPLFQKEQVRVWKVDLKHEPDFDIPVDWT
jgi:hypothetical protein